MIKEFSILVVDDQMEYRDVLKLILEESGFAVDTADSGENALEKIQNTEYDLVLTDLIMDGMDGIELLRRIKYLNNKIEVIIITGYGSIENAVHAMKEGAFSYFIKSHNPDELLSEVRKVIQLKDLEKESKTTKNLGIISDFYLETKSRTYRKTLQIAKKAAQSNSNILILGESGVGKEVIAKYIHKNSDRKDLTFVDVNCHGFSDTLFESEFFGHEKGAFTGAVDRRIGRFELADKGVLFLDEIGNISFSAQSKLLKAIESKKIERIGSNKVIDIDFRLITATNKNLTEEIENGTFRDDLYYRLSTITINVPPLRKRREDIQSLFYYFVRKYSLELDKDIIDIDEAIINHLNQYDFPGNIRELKNMTERLVVLTEDGILRLSDLLETSSDNNKDVSKLDKEIVPLREIRKEAESNYIKKVLEICEYNVSESARQLGISRRQLFNKISEYSLK
ncbi:DNA-binding transcriptional response regulator, NtrC family, contains REC, AAA-type ATPase, and a Fis-type DNA-binding domains [Dethiosulfatibacter aminovorans DSM 17477]|uniref:DNA-binding transcriptional response regulator, NtrC family, contains REC, AAA-type ATPase, and a Fis-type DNA-binding domains n=1 Tax=Dethiosulfatibacter aminovorans DSM 17477 TaxID=1121476 RepID=A0A1M6IHD6_9FIRM|nr:sigma-54 dependent transcriptional regulator [Dethiosulfatibacter aminovorans]SHJ33849.1 DNA-binding transcriptional response regulator, NtrC family, contains REC, AAA-type ATPase, and a Fis-type DNA-binding domains [Dethiosulfatibacter aminovorans DSM 17477]